MSETIKKSDALRAATKKLPLKRAREIEENLSYFCGSMAEAYRVGAEEAQREIAGRIRALAPAQRSKPSSVPLCPICESACGGH